MKFAQACALVFALYVVAVSSPRHTSYGQIDDALLIVFLCIVVLLLLPRKGVEHKKTGDVFRRPFSYRLGRIFGNLWRGTTRRD